MTDDGIALELGDRIAQIAERLGRPGAFSSDSPRLRNLNIIWQFYASYLREVQRRQPGGKGYPVWLIEDSFHLEKFEIGPKTLDRAWFESRTPGGTEIVWAHQDRGYQWWILTWIWNHKLLTVSVTHWMILHDSELKRNTVYFTRGFTFREDPVTSKYRDRLVDSNTNLGKVPKSHRERVMKLARHATQDNKEDWVLVLAPYSLFGTIFDLHNLIKRLDFFDLHQYWLDTQFKRFWLSRVLKALWADVENPPRQDQIDFEGLLKDTWYIPNTEHFLDRERFQRIYREWIKFREWYERARAIHDQVVTFEKPFSEMVPQNEDT